MSRNPKANGRVCNLCLSKEMKLIEVLDLRHDHILALANVEFLDLRGTPVGRVVCKVERYLGANLEQFRYAGDPEEFLSEQGFL